MRWQNSAEAETKVLWSDTGWTQGTLKTQRESTVLWTWNKESQTC